MLPLLLAAALAAPAAPLELQLTSREGGINPGSETITVSTGGAIRVERRRLASPEPAIHAGSMTPGALARLRALLEQARFFSLAPELNHANGAEVSFDWELTVRLGDAGRTVRAFRFGTPAPDPAFVALVRELRELLLGLAHAPTP